MLSLFFPGSCIKHGTNLILGQLFIAKLSLRQGLSRRVLAVVRAIAKVCVHLHKNAAHFTEEGGGPEEWMKTFPVPLKLFHSLSPVYQVSAGLFHKLLSEYILFMLVTEMKPLDKMWFVIIFSLHAYAFNMITLSVKQCPKIFGNAGECEKTFCFLISILQCALVAYTNVLIRSLESQVQIPPPVKLH